MELVFSPNLCAALERHFEPSLLKATFWQIWSLMALFELEDVDLEMFVMCHICTV